MDEEIEDQTKIETNPLTEKPEPEIRVYKKRWLVLFIFICYAAINAFQFIEYNIVTNIIMRYYNISAKTVSYTSIIFMAGYLPLMVPATYIIDKKGLRVAALVGSIGTALGTTIKVFSIGRDLFYVVLIGQGFLAASELLILCLPPKLATVWFKPNEISTACALGVFGTQLGIAFGFVSTPILIKNHEDPEKIGENLKTLSWGLTAFIIPVAVAVIFFFPSHPPHPPSITQAEERENKTEFTLTKFFNSFKVLMTNRPFLIFLVPYTINIAVLFCGINTLLSQFVTAYFPNSEEDAGRIGLVMIVGGMFGSVSFGILLDKTHKFKETTFFVYLMATVSVIGFLFALEKESKLMVYISIGLVGLFTNAYVSVSLEFAMELTFPSPESTASGLMLAFSQVLGVIVTLMLGKITVDVGPFSALTIQAMMLLLGTTITICIPNRLKRQQALHKPQHNFVEFSALPLEEQ